MSSDKQRRILELAGLPGAGKTTLEAAIQKLLLEGQGELLSVKDWEQSLRSLSFLPPSRLLFYGKVFVQTLLGKSFRANPFSFLSAQDFAPLYWYHKDLEYSSLFDSYEPYAAGPVPEEGAASVFFPEGLLQHAANLLCRCDGLSREALAEEILGQGKKRSILFVRTSAEEALERVKVRGVPGSWKGQEARFFDRFADFEEHLDYFLALLSEQAWPVKEISGKLTEQEREPCLRDALKALGWQI